ncbi:hypothetical protein SmJEL517_g03634 [Synchytrium microbalum]|uniref:Uncharacterized protein n=1 Tax=Synchytrium microbalum TaxID=1806994 RepID=A0A507C7K9_9FUNG|nr:uncharacterized protein SmJEL517_g03634 [Synchytrium microbalum]TPX33475.1 hypothetical protein SmJEL517_g03634 [Synchytrium microbalum]
MGAGASRQAVKKTVASAAANTTKQAANVPPPPPASTSTIPDYIQEGFKQDQQVIHNFGQLHFDVKSSTAGVKPRKDNDFLDILKNRTISAQSQAQDHESQRIANASPSPSTTRRMYLTVQDIEHVLALYRSNPRKWTVDALVKEARLLNNATSKSIITSLITHLNTPQPGNISTNSTGVYPAVWK